MLEDLSKVINLFNKYKPNFVVHLAAQAGVRYSIENPSSYIQSNIIGTFNLLEALKEFEVEHFLMAYFQCMEQMKNYHLPKMIKQIIRYQFMQLLKSTETLSHSIHIHLIFRQLYLDFLLFMDHGEGLTCFV